MLTLLLLAALQDWPQFRGPAGDGRSDVNSLPSRWSEGSPQIAWRTRIEGLGWSSPVVADGKVWLTTATEEGRSLRAICVDAKSGAVLHDVEVFRRDAVPKIHVKNSHASPTPILDAGRVYVHFGAAGTACLSAEGRMLWKQQLRYEPVHGPGGSPVLAGNLLVVNCDGAESPFVAALDRATGALRWKTPRPESTGKRFSFCTPALVGGQLVSPGANGVTSYDPANGRAIWDARYPGGYSVVPRPVSGHGLVFVGTGYDRPTFLAIRFDGKGDVTQSHVTWKLEKGAPLNPSPLLLGDELYLVSDAGIATCLDAKSGRIHWQERLGGTFSASPLFAAGRIHFLDENGALSLVAPGTGFKVLGKNEIKGRTLASPAPQEGALLLRTDTHLVRIQD